MLRTSNPALNNPAFAGQGAAQTWGDLGMDSYDPPATPAASSAAPNHMTMQGVVNKSALLIAITVVVAAFSWKLLDSNPGLMMPMWILSMVGMIGGPLVASFRPQLSVVTAPIVALAVGPFVGGFSKLAANMVAPSSGTATGIKAGVPDLILNAGLLTFGIFGGLLAAYSFKLIRPNRMFYNIVTTATIGVALYALIAIGASFFGSFDLISVYSMNNGGPISIGFSLLLVGLASANLVLDFDMISNGVRNRAPRYMEWFAAQGLLITLVWLYIEVVRLLAKLQSRD
jgi:uncharacterized YccA/Bax inhibitor family protein